MTWLFLAYGTLFAALTALAVLQPQPSIVILIVEIFFLVVCGFVVLCSLFQMCKVRWEVRAKNKHHHNKTTTTTAEEA